MYREKDIFMFNRHNNAIVSIFGENLTKTHILTCVYKVHLHKQYTHQKRHLSQYLAFIFIDYT